MATVTGSGTRTGTIVGRVAGKVWVVASATSRRDSVFVVVGPSTGSGSPPPGSPPPPPASFASVVVTPQSGSLTSGQTLRFAAYGRLTNGDSVAITVAWSAGGGTISAGGLYTAGAITGSYRVVGVSGGKADTAAMTIAGAPVPPPTVPPSVPPGLAGCPASGYQRLVSVNTDGQLATALNGAQPGDQIRIAAGTYSGNQSMSRGGTASAPVVVCGVEGHAPVLKGGKFTSSASYVTFTGLIFEGANAVDQLNLVYVHSCDHVVFTGNEIRGGHYHAGLSMDEINHVTVTDNYIHDNGHDPHHDHGIYFKTTTGPGNVIANNLLVRNASRGISLHDNTGVGVYDVLVTGNTAVNNGSTGILVNDGDRNTVANNISAGNGAATGQDQIRIRVGSANKALNNLTWSSDASRAGIENTAGATLSGNRIGGPNFLSASDFHLQVGSPAIGLALGAYVVGPDYDGKARGTSPDAGAFEH
ncbi:MAG: right-handed parallel beta-helix repeat-containing protein [Gemmatimonadales bacterium]